MKNPSKTQFHITKIKTISGGGLSVEYDLQEIIGADTYKSKQKQDSTKQPHPDLEDKLFSLVPMVAQIFCFTNPVDVVFNKEFGADILQKERMRKYGEWIEEKIRINGVAVSGEDKKKGVVIMASFAVDNGQRVAINTPRILVSSESRGFEQKLSDLVDELEGEAYSFIYNSKVANPEIFDYSEEEKDELPFGESEEKETAENE